MAETRLSDSFVPTLFAREVLEETTRKSALWQSGVLSTDPRITQQARGAGKIIDLPFWNDLPQAESVISSDNPATLITPQKLTSGKDIAHKHFRAQAWSAMDLVDAQVQASPWSVIAQRVASYWRHDQDETLISACLGVLADNVANDSGDMRLDIYSDVASPAASNLFSVDSVIQARQTAGDAMNEFVAVAMHSAVYARLLRSNLVNEIPATENQAGVRIETFQGMRIFVSDALTATAGTNSPSYTTILMGRGAFAYAEGSPRVPAEIDRNPAAGNGEGQETLYTRRHYVLHPRGVKFTGSPAGESPTNTELKAAASWDRVYDRKHVRLAFVKSNA